MQPNDNGQDVAWVVTCLVGDLGTDCRVTGVNAYAVTWVVTLQWLGMVLGSGAGGTLCTMY